MTTFNNNPFCRFFFSRHLQKSHTEQETQAHTHTAQLTWKIVIAHTNKVEMSWVENKKSETNEWKFSVSVYYFTTQQIN